MGKNERKKFKIENKIMQKINNNNNNNNESK